MNDPAIFLDFREYNLKNSNNYYLYSPNKLNSIDYVNDHIELKNIYRSYIAFRILTAKDNLKLILSFYVNSLERIVTVLKDAMEVKNNACLEHFILLLKALIIEQPEDTLSLVV
mmetsp:Transcript_39881/g.38432  ORF Transcript_39881/g.38432 Transcript_39881/m.38432 type:complete len:114 (+) Transcript_39881:106-447(+)